MAFTDILVSLRDIIVDLRDIPVAFRDSILVVLWNILVCVLPLGQEHTGRPSSTYLVLKGLR